MRGPRGKYVTGKAKQKAIYEVLKKTSGEYITSHEILAKLENPCCVTHISRICKELVEEGYFSRVRNEWNKGYSYEVLIETFR